MTWHPFDPSYTRPDRCIVCQQTESAHQLPCPQCRGQVQTHPKSDDFGLCSRCGHDIYAGDEAA